MHDSNDLDLMVMASMMPVPEGLLLLAALDGARRRPLPDAEEPDFGPDFDAVGMTMLLIAVTLVVGLLMLLPAMA